MGGTADGCSRRSSGRPSDGGVGFFCGMTGSSGSSGYGSYGVWASMALSPPRCAQRITALPGRAAGFGDPGETVCARSWPPGNDGLKASKLAPEIHVRLMRRDFAHDPKGLKGCCHHHADALPSHHHHSPVVD
jgi:hypothetical protein